MNKLTKAAIVLTLLSSPWAWMQQVLAARTAELSISAVVTGNCRIRMIEPSGIYVVDCSDNVARPQTLRTTGDLVSQPTTGDAPARTRNAADTGNGPPRRESVTTLVY